MFTKDKLFYEKLWKLMIPMMLQNLMLALVAVADAFMLGGMNQNYMSSVYPEYGSFRSNRWSGNSWSTVLGQGKYPDTG